ncbi:MAG: RNB domain-containing ribonuclease [Cumulibacter sp.]
MNPRRIAAGIDFQRVRDDLHVCDAFGAEAQAEADRAAAAPRLPESDDTDIPLVTLDPPGSRDLDQAVHIATDGAGFLVSYAIADLGAFVEPGGALDVETRLRGQTLYCPDKRVGLHPDVLSEGAASLLPEQIRPAALWQLRLDAEGELIEASVRRTKVRSSAQLDYESAQQAFDDASAHPSLALLAQVGPLRLKIAAERNAINLNLPEQVVEKGEQGWELGYRRQLPCELWNAEISLLTGMAASEMMLAAGIGILRTLPPASEDTLREVAQTARRLGIAWPDGAHVSEVLDGLDRGSARNVAFIEQSAQLLRGAGYLAFVDERPESAAHAAIGSTYAHVTAPVRRLVDRFGTEVCLAHCAGQPVPAWVRDSLAELPEIMSKTSGLEGRLENAIISSLEALLLQDSVGSTFGATVVDRSKQSVTVVLDEPAVRARAEGLAELGAHVDVRVVKADPQLPELRLDVVGDADGH